MENFWQGFEKSANVFSSVSDAVAKGSGLASKTVAKKAIAPVSQKVISGKDFAAKIQGLTKKTAPVENIVQAGQQAAGKQIKAQPQLWKKDLPAQRDLPARPVTPKPQRTLANLPPVISH